MPLPTPTFRKVASMSFPLSLLPASQYLFETPGLDINKACLFSDNGVFSRATNAVF